MKKTLLFGLFTLGFSTLQAQELESKKGTYFGVSFSPEFAYRALINNENDASLESFIESRNEAESPKLSFTGGLNFGFYLSPKRNTAIEIGVHYSDKGYQIPWEEAIFPQIVPGLPTRIKTVYGYHFLEMPIRFVYWKGSKKVRFVASAGFVSGVLFSQTINQKQEFEDGSRESKMTELNDNVNKFNISPMVSAGVSFHPTEKWSIRTEPNFKYGLVNIRPDMPVSMTFWSYGVNFGVFYSL